MTMSASSIFLILLFVLFSSRVVSSVETNQCYSDKDDPYLLMGTRTAYETGRGNITRLPDNSNCKPVQIWTLIRHGIRYPDGKTISQFSSLKELRDEIIDNHEKRGRGKLCLSDLENLRNWLMKPEPSEMTPNSLTSRGEIELQSLAKRLQAAFPELLQVANPRNVSDQVYKFRATDKQRTQASMRAFMDGLFDDKGVVKPEKPPKNDSLLYTYKNCPAYEESLISDPVVNDETEKFTAGPEFRNLLQNVSDRLGFDRIMDTDKLLLMYEACRFETAWHRDDSNHAVSAWCAAFSPEDIKALEYREDVGCYYYCGPGRRINELLGCPTLQDMMRHFRNLEENISSEPKGIFYFSHTVTLQATMAAMGIGKDATPLLASNYESVKNRTFRTSLIGSFAGNIIAVFYRCSDAKSPNKVTIHVSERLWPLPGCANGVCDWESFKRNYGDAADQCNLNFCYQ